MNRRAKVVGLLRMAKEGDSPILKLDDRHLIILPTGEALRAEPAA